MRYDKDMEIDAKLKNIQFYKKKWEEGNKKIEKLEEDNNTLRLEFENMLKNLKSESKLHPDKDLEIILGKNIDYEEISDEEVTGTHKGDSYYLPGIIEKSNSLNYYSLIQKNKLKNFSNQIETLSTTLAETHKENETLKERIDALLQERDWLEKEKQDLSELLIQTQEMVEELEEEKEQNNQLIMDNTSDNDYYIPNSSILVEDEKGEIINISQNQPVTLNLKQELMDSIDLGHPGENINNSELNPFNFGNANILSPIQFSNSSFINENNNNQLIVNSTSPNHINSGSNTQKSLFDELAALNCSISPIPNQHISNNSTPISNTILNDSINNDGKKENVNFEMDNEIPENDNSSTNNSNDLENELSNIQINTSGKIYEELKASKFNSTEENNTSKSLANEHSGLTNSEINNVKEGTINNISDNKQDKISDIKENIMGKTLADELNDTTNIEENDEENNEDNMIGKTLADELNGLYNDEEINEGNSVGITLADELKNSFNVEKSNEEINVNNMIGKTLADELNNSLNIEEKNEESKEDNKISKTLADELNNSLNIEEKNEENKEDNKISKTLADELNNSLNIEEKNEENKEDNIIGKTLADELNNSLNIEENNEENKEDNIIGKTLAYELNNSLNIKENDEENNEYNMIGKTLADELNGLYNDEEINEGNSVGITLADELKNSFNVEKSNEEINVNNMIGKTLADELNNSLNIKENNEENKEDNKISKTLADELNNSLNIEENNEENKEDNKIGKTLADELNNSLNIKENNEENKENNIIGKTLADELNNSINIEENNIKHTNEANNKENNKTNSKENNGENNDLITSINKLSNISNIEESDEENNKDNNIGKILADELNETNNIRENDIYKILDNEYKHSESKKIQDNSVENSLIKESNPNNIEIIKNVSDDIDNKNMNKKYNNKNSEDNTNENKNLNKKLEDNDIKNIKNGTNEKENFVVKNPTLKKDEFKSSETLVNKPDNNELTDIENNSIESINKLKLKDKNRIILSKSSFHSFINNSKNSIDDIIPANEYTNGDQIYNYNINSNISPSPIDNLMRIEKENELKEMMIKLKEAIHLNETQMLLTKKNYIAKKLRKDNNNEDEGKSEENDPNSNLSLSRVKSQSSLVSRKSTVSKTSLSSFNSSFTTSGIKDVKTLKALEESRIIHNALLQCINYIEKDLNGTTNYNSLFKIAKENEPSLNHISIDSKPLYSDSNNPSITSLSNQKVISQPHLIQQEEYNNLINSPLSTYSNPSSQKSTENNKYLKTEIYQNPALNIDDFKFRPLSESSNQVLTYDENQKAQEFVASVSNGNEHSLSMPSLSAHANSGISSTSLKENSIITEKIIPENNQRPPLPPLYYSKLINNNYNNNNNNNNNNNSNNNNNNDNNNNSPLLNNDKNNTKQDFTPLISNLNTDNKQSINVHNEPENLEYATNTKSNPDNNSNRFKSFDNYKHLSINSLDNDKRISVYSLDEKQLPEFNKFNDNNENSTFNKNYYKLIKKSNNSGILENIEAKPLEENFNLNQKDKLLIENDIQSVTGTFGNRTSSIYYNQDHSNFEKVQSFPSLLRLKNNKIGKGGIEKPLLNEFSTLDQELKYDKNSTELGTESQSDIPTETTDTNIVPSSELETTTSSFIYSSEDPTEQPFKYPVNIKENIDQDFRISITADDSILSSHSMTGGDDDHIHSSKINKINNPEKIDKIDFNNTLDNRESSLCSWSEEIIDQQQNNENQPDELESDFADLTKRISIGLVKAEDSFIIENKTVEPTIKIEGTNEETFYNILDTIEDKTNNENEKFLKLNNNEKSVTSSPLHNDIKDYRKSLYSKKSSKDQSPNSISGNKLLNINSPQINRYSGIPAADNLIPSVYAMDRNKSMSNFFFFLFFFFFFFFFFFCYYYYYYYLFIYLN